MKPDYKLTTVLLVILGVLDLVAIPFMIAANHHTKGTPPVAAIVVVGVIAIATLISAFGVARGLRWAFWVAMTGRVIDGLSNFLGLTNHPSTATTVGGWLGFILSIVAIVLLVRVNPRRAARRAAAGAASAQSVGADRRSQVVPGNTAGPADETPPGRVSSAGPAAAWVSCRPRRCPPRRCACRSRR